MRRGSDCSVTGTSGFVLGKFLQKLRGDRSLDLERDDDPRGGQQSDEYRSADPREVVDEGGTVMSGPGGAPQEDASPDERRDRDRG
jgi:hypothetical protein